MTNGKVVRFSDFTICHIQMCLVVHDPLSVCLHLCESGLASKTVTVQVNHNTGQKQFCPCLSCRTCSPQSSSVSTAESPYCRIFGECQFDCWTCFECCECSNQYVCMYVRMHVRMYVRTYVCMYVCTYAGMYVRMYICMYVCTYAGMYVRMYICMYVCLSVCLYVCM